MARGSSTCEAIPGRLILPKQLQDSSVLGVEARDHAGLSGWGHLLCSVQSMSVVGLGLRIGEGICRTIIRQGAVFHGFGPLLPLGEMVGQSSISAPVALCWLSHLNK